VSNGRIVLFGATGYTGQLTARALVARGAHPILAARSPQRLEQLADELGGVDTRIADVSRPESVRALVETGDVLISTVGPFTRWGQAAVEAAIDARATYIDSTGEPQFIRRIFQEYGPRATTAGCSLLTAFGYDWVPGNLAGALALRDAGPAATRLEIGYFSHGAAGTSRGTQASTISALLEPSFAFRDAHLRTERAGARVKSFPLPDGTHRQAVSVGGSEHFALPASYPHLRDIDVLLGMTGAHVRYMPAISAAIATATQLPAARTAIRTLLQRRVTRSTDGPDPVARERSSSIITAIASTDRGHTLSTITLQGVNGYTFTAEILTWAAMTTADTATNRTGALGPVSAFGLNHLAEAAQRAGIAQTPKP
jgi:short subunit dehydrogenase-like uncharacterized protein